jgi:hypothetical protein
LDGISEQLSKQHTALSNQLEAFTQSSMMEKQTKEFLLNCLKQIQEQQPKNRNKNQRTDPKISR